MSLVWLFHIRTILHSKMASPVTAMQKTGMTVDMLTRFVHRAYAKNTSIRINAHVENMSKVDSTTQVSRFSLQLK